ncbi:hypothetical protein Nepgr_020873 [Nepenthes gracilis]|uniref:Uncharacterized protein n=1 Tax=Nepenthes gracilis TaxID=150966 RepID=A0AAD3XVF8_NEPGR|nr:hypothetical protein Nepgr_020873 [Nepenthes gracilis]
MQLQLWSSEHIGLVIGHKNKSSSLLDNVAILLGSLCSSLELARQDIDFLCAVSWSSYFLCNIRNSECSLLQMAIEPVKLANDAVADVATTVIDIFIYGLEWLKGSKLLPMLFDPTLFVYYTKVTEARLSPLLIPELLLIRRTITASMESDAVMLKKNPTLNQNYGDQLICFTSLYCRCHDATRAHELEKHTLCHLWFIPMQELSIVVRYTSKASLKC